MRTPKPLPEMFRGRDFTVAEAKVAGISSSRLRRSDLDAPFRGIRSPTGSLSTADLTHAESAENYWDALRAMALARAAAYAPALDPRAAFSHLTAAKAHGFPLRSAQMRDLEVHVSTATREARPRARGVTAHFSPRDLRAVVMASGLRVTTPVQTWVALSGNMSTVELVGIGDHLLRRKRPDATLGQLQRAVDRAAGRHGVKRLREALELIRPRTDSVRETQVRLLLTDAGLPEPRVNAPLHDLEGRFIRHGDMVYPEYGVLVEYDGEQHRTDDEQYHRDKRQLEQLIAAGWIVVHVLKADMRDHAGVAQRVRRALHARGWR
ncbi:hypothetical protein ACFQZV_01035 [Microbacterium koreense]|uniref:DUF559 domain-containing protein n=1 Tax=Microbacterium koreense TaxID=323761 RepID=A0ABW2ZNA0_9MICO